MKHWYPVITVLVALSIILGACGGSPAATQPPATPQVVTKQITVEVTREVTRVVTAIPQPINTTICALLDCKKRILVLSAFGDELAPLIEAATIEKTVVLLGRTIYLGTLEGNDVALTESGTSMINAAMHTQALLDHLNISRIVFSGISGGVSPQRNVGDVVYPARWSEYQEFFFARETSPGVFTLPFWFSTSAPKTNFGMMFPQGVWVTRKDGIPDQEEEVVWFEVDPEMLSVARRSLKNVVLDDCAGVGNCLIPKPVIASGGRGVSGQTFVDNAAFREYVWNTWRPQSLEMESAAVAHVADVNRVPFIIIRSLSDLAGGGPGENEITIFFRLAANNSARVLRTFLHGWANRDTLPPEETIKVAFVYVGPQMDLGWSYAHDQGRLYLEKNVPQVETAFSELVGEGPDSTRVIRDYAEKGYNVIFATSFGFMDSVIEVAKDYPEVTFEHCTGYLTAENVGIYDGRGYQGWYLAGIVAGSMTKNGKLGYIAPYPIPEVVRNMNAFALGARSVNPTATVTPIWLMAWVDPPREREAATALADAGCDVIARESDSTEPDKLAQERGIYAIGYNTYLPDIAPKALLTAPIWNWGLVYQKVVEEMRDGLWLNEPIWWGMKEGLLEMAPYGQMVPQDVRALADAAKAQILAGTFDVFVGPIKDNTGKERLAKDKVMSDPEKLSFNWLVEGVEGTIPK